MKKITMQWDSDLEFPFPFVCLSLSRLLISYTIYNTSTPTPISYLFHSVNSNNHSKSPMSIINQNSSSSSSSSNMMDQMKDNRNFKTGRTCTNRDRVDMKTKSINDNSKLNRRRKLVANQNNRRRVERYREVFYFVCNTQRLWNKRHISGIHYQRTCSASGTV